MAQNKRRVGEIYEKRAAAFLEELGYEILAFHFRCRFGEIDLIARLENTLVFLEVKYRATAGCGDPSEAVTKKKQRTICRVADFYRVRHQIRDDVSCRFDVISILGEELRHIPNAFEYQW